MWTDEKPFEADEEFVASFKRVGKPLVCFFCGKELVVGDSVRWVFTNTAEVGAAIHGNPFIHIYDCIAEEKGCVGGDGPELIQRMKYRAAQAKAALQRFEWFLGEVRNKVACEAERAMAREERRNRGYR